MRFVLVLLLVLVGFGTFRGRGRARDPLSASDCSSAYVGLEISPPAPWSRTHWPCKIVRPENTSADEKKSETDRERIRRAAAKVWPGIPCYATNDLETALMAADDAAAAVHESRGKRRSPSAVTVRVLVLSGTGSCCFARARDGRTAKVGGWGHILGDKGSGFEIGLRALKAVVYYYDCEGAWSKLGQQILRKLQLNAPDDLID